MKVLSLFSGVGGFDMGLEAVGMNTVFQCEIDRHARSVLDHHWPDVPKWDDVTTLTGAHVLETTGGVDVVAWGSPCQDLSLAGKRKGLSGERSGLFHEGIRIIKELRELSNGKYPTWSIWENVYGALSSNGGADFGQVLWEMDEAGACFSEWVVLDAQYFGVPQRRRRVFVASCFDSATSARCPDPLFPVAQSLPRDFAKGAKAGEAVAGEIAAGVGRGGYTDDSGILRGTVTSKWAKGSGGPVGDEAYNLVVEPTTFVKAKQAMSSTDNDRWEQNDVSPTLNAFDVGDTRTVTAVVEVDPIGTLQARQHKGVNHEGARDGHLVVEHRGIIGSDIEGSLNASDWKFPQQQQVHENKIVIQDAIPIQDGRDMEKRQNGFGVGAKGDPSYTIDQTGGQSVAHEPMLVDGRRVDDVRVYAEPVQTLQERMGTGGNNVPVVAHGQSLVVRRLTPLECERLMGWPDQHTSIGINGPISDTQRYKMCGNGVASPVAAWLGKHILNV